MLGDRDGEGFFIDFLDVYFIDYSILAIQAALKRMLEQALAHARDQEPVLEKARS